MKPHRLTLPRCLMLLFSVLFLACGCWLGWLMLVLPARQAADTAALRELYRPTPIAVKGGSSVDAVSVQTMSEGGNSADFTALKAACPDAVGWISIPNTNIDLPVVQSSRDNPDFYLTHDVHGQPSNQGAIYLDARCSLADSQCLILYGHNLTAGNMFTELEKYKQLSFYQENPVFSLDLEGKPQQWAVFATLLVSTLPSQGEPFDYLRTEFRDSEAFLQFGADLRARSLYSTGVTIEKDDRLLLLSTCSYEREGYREVVAARAVRPGEPNEEGMS